MLDQSLNQQTVQMELKELNLVWCLYDSLPLIDMVDETSEKFGDYLITFTYPHVTAKQFHCPSETDKCWVTEDNKYSVQDQHSISENDAARISSVCPDWIIARTDH